MRAEAHLHLPRKIAGNPACISVRRLPNYQVEYAGTLTMTNATFAVQPAGLQKFRQTGQKNVHAYVRGEIVELLGNQVLPRHNMREAYYNPKTCDTFVDKDTNEPLYEAAAVYMVGSKVFYIPKGN